MKNLKAEINQWRRANFVIIFAGNVNEFAAVLEVASVKLADFDADGWRICNQSIGMLTRKLNVPDLIDLASELPGEVYVRGGNFITT